MSLKENVEYIKHEISAEESFMESFFKLEKFYKKYKLLLISFATIVVIGTAGYYTNGYFIQQNKIAANIAFNTLLKNPNDTKAKAILQDKNSELYSVIEFINNNTIATNTLFLKELSDYANAIKANNIDKLSEVSLKQQFLLKDFALVNKAILEIKAKDYQSAKETIKLISVKSEVTPLKTMLEHFLLTK